MPDQINGQHLSHERCRHGITILEPVAVTDPELAVAINRGCLHQIADPVDHFRVRLPAFSKTADNMFKHPYRFVCTAQRQLFDGDGLFWVLTCGCMAAIVAASGSPS